MLGYRYNLKIYFTVLMKVAALRYEGGRFPGGAAWATRRIRAYWVSQPSS